MEYILKRELDVDLLQNFKAINCKNRHSSPSISIPESQMYIWELQ